MRFWHVITVAMCISFIAGSSSMAHAADEKITLNYEKPYKTAGPRTTYYDLSKIDLRITALQILPMDDTPTYALDDADLVKITINVTNKGSERFIVLDKMFELWIMETNRAVPDGFSVVDNYDTTYDDQFEVIYEEMNSRELFNECDQTIDGIDPGESIGFTLCYDILRTISGGVDLDGPKKYALVMMDNQQATSCPNCKKITLAKNLETEALVTTWVSKLYDWEKRHLISEQELQNALDYLVKKKIPINTKKFSDSLTLKNEEFAKYQRSLSKAYNENLFVSAIQMLEYEPADKFSGIVCKKQNNIITLDADYTNGNVGYDVVFFRLKVFDVTGNIAVDGLAKIVDVAPKSFRHLSVSAPAVEEPNYCTVEIDSRFP